MNHIIRTLASLMRSPMLGRQTGDRAETKRKPPGRRATALLAVLLGLVGLGAAAQKKVAPASTAATPSHSTTIALTSDEQRVVVVNREANSLSNHQSQKYAGPGYRIKIAEIGVGEEPRCVAVHPNDQEAYVTNGISDTVSVVNLAQRRVVATIRVGTEPRGCALTADGSLLYVANHTEGTVSIVDTASRTVVGSVEIHNPSTGGCRTCSATAIAITNKGTGDISDDTVFVTQLFAELIDAGPGETRDLGGQGIVHAFPAGNANPRIGEIILAPLDDSGFNANRLVPNNLCAANADSLIFCPNPKDTTDPINTNNPQGVFPNQLLSAVIRGNRLEKHEKGRC